jgi:hypothetical protein
MADKKAAITNEEPLKRGHSVPLMDTGEADKEIHEIPPDETRRSDSAEGSR